MKKNISFKNVYFVKTAVRPEHYPLLKTDAGVLLPEVAVAGRSNVGKSSLLNHLFLRKDLVKTSSAPGKTQAINFFSVNDSLLFVDLPGYGYAQVPAVLRKEWGPMVHTYLAQRPSLKLILFLLDIRRLPNEDDLAFVEWVIQAQKAMILVLTKCDKVSRHERLAQTQKILQILNCDSLHYVHYSVVKKEGRQELINMMLDALEDEDNGPS